MSVQALYTAATGMNALETRLDVIADNLANVNTTAFKAARCNFEDLYYRQLKLPGTQDAQQNYTPTGIAVGLGTRVQSTQTDFAQGAFQSTDNPLDIAIDGPGFFVVIDPSSGQNEYTRAGNFSVNPNGQIVVGSAQTGRVLYGSPTVPPDTINISVSGDGNVTAQQSGTTQFSQIGQIQLARFINPEGLLKMGENLFAETLSSGPPTIANPNVSGLGTLVSSTLELSNVSPVNELVNLITTQRSFELNSQAVQAGDQIMQLINNLRRF
jgi:flagellar basal-body rod protein FlgG